MAICCARYCFNSSAKGFKLYRFPKNKKQRRLWIAKIGRRHWVPGPRDALCSVHFTDKLTMIFKSARYGKHAIKMAAVPTIFDYESIKKKSEEYVKKKNSQKNVLKKKVNKTLCASCQSYKMERDALKKKVLRTADSTINMKKLISLQKESKKLKGLVQFYQYLTMNTIEVFYFSKFKELPAAVA